MPGTWTPLVTQPTFNTSTMILLSDSRIMIQEDNTPFWHALTATNGSYVHGRWSDLAPMSLWRRYYASAVLKDGRLFVCGGEDNGDPFPETNKGEIYDPTLDQWSPIPDPPWAK